jgi:serine/threonine protein kinase
VAIPNLTQLGPYEILAPLGAGGMGEVYRARDTRLDRIVAIKVLPSHLSSNPDFRQRFEREARTVSALNHENICTLHDIGHQNGIHYLVMEFIDGETLGSRLKKGPLSTTEVLRYSIQIADALDRAHKKGVIHRDLKPGNIMLTKSGVKLLDFGLAKITSAKPVAEVSQLVTHQQELTGQGMILGTLQYMAPEQLEGKETDARTDIFAFGTVVYEMATGKKAFEGTSQASLIAAILKEQPKPFSQIQPLAPPSLERLVKTCLEKDPEDRWQSIHDVSSELRWISESSAQSVTTPARKTEVTKSSRTAWIVASILALLLGGYLVWTNFHKQNVRSSEVRFMIPPDVGTKVSGTIFQGIPEFSILHDGTKLAYVVTDSTGKTQLWLRSITSLTAQPIQGTEEAVGSFFAPDDQQIAFVSDGALKKTTLSGGTPQIICKIRGGFLGGVWLSDGTIFFGSESSGLSRVSSNGGDPEPVTTLNKERGEITHSYPTFLPDGKRYLFTVDSTKLEFSGVYLGSLGSDKIVRIVSSDYKANYLDPGYLLFLRGTTLYAQRLELDPPKLTGDLITIADQLSVSSAANNAPFTASFNGTILYRGGGSWAKTQLGWFDRNGKLIQKIGGVGSDISVRLSPDSKQAAVASTTGPTFKSGAGEESVNIWVIDLTRDVRTRITFDPVTSDENPIWSPDGRLLAFASHRNTDRASIYQRPSSGEGQDRAVISDVTANPHPESWSPDGKNLLVHYNGKRMDIGRVWLQDSEPKVIPYVTSLADDVQAEFSPNGRWVAFTSVESGQNEVYVRPFPQGDGKWQISSNGGSEPKWRGDGKELFYLTPDGTMMAVPVTSEPTFSAALPITLFKTGTLPIDIGAWGAAGEYDVSKDGKKFIINTIVTQPTPANLYVIVNWKPPSY